METASDTASEKAVEKFQKEVNAHYAASIEEFEDYKANPSKSKLSAYKLKYPHTTKKRLGKNTKIDHIKRSTICVNDFICARDHHPEQKISDDDKTHILKYCLEKVKGIYKHAQALKTGYCNLLIMKASSENQLTIAITKNTLEANGQWIQRILKDLDRRWPSVKTDHKVMIISSKKNTLGGNATHCKNMDVAWRLLSSNHRFSVIFVCSNSTRMSDILELTTLMQRQRSDLIKNLNIIHDEAHNSKEGVPAHRRIVENIILQPIVNTYIPCTASNNSLVEEDNPLWNRDNLESQAIDYTDFNKVKSSDPDYSSIQDAKRCTFEDLMKHEKWTCHHIQEVSREDFMKCDDKYMKKKEDDLSPREIDDVDKRRKLEFCSFMKHDQEKTAMNYGLNSLNMNELLGLDYFQKDRLNLHIISTPRRRIITRTLAKECLKKEYNPIVLAIYGNEGDKYHLFNDGKEKSVDTIMGKSEFNDKLHALFTHLRKKGVNIDRPFVIIGNYTPTGESLSFVNYEYGTVRGNIRLIHTNAEEDYQEACRSNYMDTKFKEHDSEWTHPDKFLIGEKDFIDNAVSYEMENDARIDDLGLRNPSDEVNSPVINLTHNSNVDESGGSVAAPVKLIIEEEEDERIDALREFLGPEKKKVCFKGEGKGNETRQVIKGYLKECVEEGIITMEDPFKKFNFDTFTLKRVSCWKKIHHPPNPNYWKFKSYQDNHAAHKPFMNHRNGHKKNEFELCFCIGNFVSDRDKNDDKVRNKQDVIWLSYKY
jgi:hypothetical protein